MAGPGGRIGKSISIVKIPSSPKAANSRRRLRRATDIPAHRRVWGQGLVPNA
jgi:hypothetical protein